MARSAITGVFGDNDCNTGTFRTTCYIVKTTLLL